MIPIKKLFNSLIDLIYPRICYQCEKAIETDDNYFCEKCWNKIEYINNEDLSQLTRQKFGNNIDQMIPLFYFEPDSTTQKIIHSIKYSGAKVLGFRMGKSLGEHIIRKNIKADLIVFVPLHRSRKRERTYNQSEIIAKGVSKELNIELFPDLLIRKKFTSSQTKLNKNERENNVKDAFSISEKHISKIHNKTIFLIDDVITTGSTLKACAKVLKKNGAKNIIAISLALVKNTDNTELSNLVT